MKKNFLVIALLAAAAAAVYFFRPPVEETSPVGSESAPEEERVYRNDEHGFSVDYPRSLVLVEDREAMRIFGYLPACDPETSVACFVIPPAAYPNTNFESAGLAVHVQPTLATEEECLAPPPSGFPTGEEGQAVTVNGTDFQAYDYGTAAAGHRSIGRTYRTFRDDTCYGLTTRVNTASFENFEPGAVEEFTAADEAAAEALLEQALLSFRFTDS